MCVSLKVLAFGLGLSRGLGPMPPPHLSSDCGTATAQRGQGRWASSIRSRRVSVCVPELFIYDRRRHRLSHTLITLSSPLVSTVVAVQYQLHRSHTDRLNSSLRPTPGHHASWSMRCGVVRSFPDTRWSGVVIDYSASSQRPEEATLPRIQPPSPAEARDRPHAQVRLDARQTEPVY